MKYLKNFITEKLVINANSKIKEYSDEELMNDYKEVWGATTKQEKKDIADKYGVTILKIRDIQLHILEILRQNRFKKKEFTREDIINFFHFEPPEREFEEYLKKEPKEFVQYLLDYYEDYTKQIRNKVRLSGRLSSLSIADRSKLRTYNKIKDFMEKNG